MRPRNNDKVLVKLGDSSSITLAPRPLQHAFADSKAADAKDAVKDIALYQVGSTMAVKAGTQIALSGIPFAGTLVSVLAALPGMSLIHKNSEIRGFEFEFLRDTKAVTELKEGAVEFFLPLNHYIPSDADITDIRPTLIQLDVMGQDSARIVTTRKVSMKTKKAGKLDRGPTTERTELSVDQKIVAADVEKGQNNTFVLKPKEPLSAGEYTLIVFGKASTGAYTENVPLKAEFSSEEMTRFIKKGEEWSGYGALAWDFQVVK